MTPDTWEHVAYILLGTAFGGILCGVFQVFFLKFPVGYERYEVLLAKKGSNVKK
jgi:hypothetical protein